MQRVRRPRNGGWTDLEITPMCSGRLEAPEYRPRTMRRVVTQTVQGGGHPVPSS